MKELQWREGMTIDEKLEAGFKEVLRRFDAQDQEMNAFRRFVSQKFFEISNRFSMVDGRFDKLESKMDGVFKVLHNHDEDIVLLQKAVGQK